MMGHLVFGRYGPVETSSPPSKGWFRRVWQQIFGHKAALADSKAR